MGEPMSVPKRMRFEVFRRDGFRCRYCGAAPEQAELRPDHVVPEALGGKTEPANLVTACNDCNSGKSSTLLDTATVAEVDQHAARWARAVAAAAVEMERDRQAVEERNAWFLETWNTWTANGRPLPLPPNWPATIDGFLDAGLTQSLILDAVGTAMNTRGVEDEFRYTCGICWRLVGELHERAKASLGDVAGHPDPGRAERHLTVLDVVKEALDNCYDLPHWVYDTVVLEVAAKLEAMP